MVFRYQSDVLTNICISCISATLTICWLYYHNKNNNYITKVLFYVPVFNNECNCKSFFNINCSATNCSSKNTREIINYIQNAKYSIDIAVFSISNKPIAKAIKKAHFRGVCIRIIISNCILRLSKEVKCFEDAGISLKYPENKNNYMHNKYAIIDSTWLINGSMNWTHQGTFFNWENVLITNSQTLVSEYSKYFEKSWLIIT